MIALWNRWELTITFSPAQQGKIRGALAAHGIDYSLRTVSRSSPARRGNLVKTRRSPAGISSMSIKESSNARGRRSRGVSNEKGQAAVRKYGVGCGMAAGLAAPLFVRWKTPVPVALPRIYSPRLPPG